MPVPVSRPVSLPASRPTPSRRAVDRGTAWTAPLLVVSTAAPAFAASTCTASYSYLLDWGTTPWSRASALSAYATIASTNGGPTLYAVFSVVTVGNNTPDATRNLTIPPNSGMGTTLDPVVTNLGAIGGNMRGVRFQHSASQAGRANRQEVTVTFRKNSTAGPVVNVSGLGFWITDIDAITTTDYSDRVELTPAVPAGQQTRDANITGAGVDGSPNNAWRTTVANSNVGENADGARVRISYAAATAFSSFKLTYWNATGGDQYHRVFLSDLSFSSTGC
jgi:hypothetical protein